MGKRVRDESVRSRESIEPETSAREKSGIGATKRQTIPEGGGGKRESRGELTNSNPRIGSGKRSQDADR